MARIPESEIERLKREVSVERLVEACGVTLRRHGTDLLGLCPFHDDHEPSLVVSPAKNLWHCLGACQAGGSAIDWVMKGEGVSFRHAVERLREDLPPVALAELVAEVPPAAAASSHAEASLSVASSAENRELLQRVVRYYHETLKQSPEALSYLASRGLQSGEMIERFQLGFANRTLTYKLPSGREGAELRERLQKLGILRGSGHEHFNGSVVVPVFDEAGQVVEIYGRKITPNLRKGTPQHLYLPGPHAGVWNVAALGASKEIILCEALVDALTFWCAGFRNVTAAYGIEGFTADHLAAFERYGTERVLIAYDRDEAGERAAEALSAKLLAAGIDCFRIQFPRGMDANDYARHVTPATKSLGLAIRQAVWLGQGRPAPAIETSAAQLGLGAEPRPAAEASAVTEPSASPPPEAAAAPAPPVPPPSPIATAPPALSPLAAASFSDDPAASPLPPAPKVPELPLEVKPEEVVLTLGDRRYRVRGMAKNLSYETLKINLLAARGEGFHVDTLDLYSARQRGGYIQQAGAELGVEPEVIQRDLGQVLLALERLQDEQIQAALRPKEQPAVELSAEAREAALELLQSPDLLDRIVADFTRCGMVGEETNKLVGYLAAVSRKLDEPLAVVVQSSSAAGKSALMDAVLSLVPEEDRVQYSAMTGQSLFYMGGIDLRHKVLAIVEEQGAERASYALKLLQSEGELTIASTGKDPASGKLVTQEYRVEGPVMIFLTTTAIEIDEELLNRCVVLTVDEEREQTRAIHREQRESQTLEGLLRRLDRDEVRQVHRNAQRLLRPLLVTNPYARELTFHDGQTRTRRDHMKYLTLIRSIALLHQYQRPVRSAVHRGRVVEHIEVELRDIEMANRLAHEVLGRSLDELPPQTRKLLRVLDAMVSEACERLAMARSDYRFSRREVRAHTGWGATQLHHHLRRLEELEYLLVHRGGRGQSFVYELLHESRGESERPSLFGLIDVAALYDGKYSGSEPQLSGSEASHSGPIRPQFGGISGGIRGRDNAVPAGLSGDFSPISPETAHLAAELPSHRTPRRNGTRPPAAAAPVARAAAAAEIGAAAEDR